LKFSLLTLGCDKNTVDSERYVAQLTDSGAEFTTDLAEAEVIVVNTCGFIEDRPVIHPGVRLFTGDLPHVRYLKVSEGCDHGCAFCAIPLMRGRHRSFGLGELVREAQLLEAQGAVEVNLVAQDLAHYGRDVRDGNGLPELLEALLAETTLPWLRLLYVYSAGLTPKLLEIMAREPRVLPYVDMPIQHASDDVLKRMRRPERRQVIRERVTHIREVVPDVAIRTTCIVGFPGETDEDFELLLNFLEETQFERVGAFTYSAQEGTHAAALADDVPDAVKRERLERLNELQRVVTAERYELRVGRVARAIVDRVEAGGIVQARTLWQADDIDGVTRLAGAAAVRPGSLVDVAIESVVDDYDFQTTLVRIISAPPAKPTRVRALPVLTASAGSYGR